ncbi:L,D-transpeptidase [Streptomyces sp. NPDC006879]|uniref:L,D-transpeptidase n=1 Tax=Streptomyces sp. NPDC006879 TaxID=3364767 RepID=UPI0036BC2F59
MLRAPLAVLPQAATVSLRRKTLVAVVAGAALLIPQTLEASYAAEGRTAAFEQAECVADTGPYQRDLEEYLGLTVDGRQSVSDCEAIRRFQEGEGVTPADGYAGVATYRTILVVEARKNPNADGECPTVRGKVACVDLARQMLWIQEGFDGGVIYRPIPVRTGRKGLETRGGMHSVYWRNREHHSTIYDVPMPYAQFFDGGQALHGTTDDLFQSGSGGCVNMYYHHAAEVWDLLSLGDKVSVFGVKPGTNPRSVEASGDAGVDEEGRSVLTDDQLVIEGMREIARPR